MSQVKAVEFAEMFIEVAEGDCHHEDEHDDGDDHEDHDDHKDHDHAAQMAYSSMMSGETWQPWIGAFVSVFIISGVSLMGAVTVGARKRLYYDHVILFLIALGIAVMISDAILHLIPHSFGLHVHGNKDMADEGHGEHGDSHGKEEHEEHENPFGESSFIWRSFAVLMGVFLFLVFEIMIAAFGGSFSHSHDTSAGGRIPKNNNNVVEMKGGVGVRNLDLVNGDVKTVTLDDVVSVLSSSRKLRFQRLKSVAWVILIGDSVHNFMDGIAIGGSFSEPFPAGFQGGVMTSIAVLIHEVPHELADFAVLVQSGLPVKQALCLNLLSSLTAFAGAVVGVILGTHWNAAPWIHAVTAGLFIYVPLATMKPEVLNHPLLKRSRVVAFFLEIGGLAVGFVIMLLLAGYEELLKSALKAH